MSLSTHSICSFLYVKMIPTCVRHSASSAQCMLSVCLMHQTILLMNGSDYELTSKNHNHWPINRLRIKVLREASILHRHSYTYRYTHFCPILIYSRNHSYSHIGGATRPPPPPPTEIILQEPTLAVSPYPDYLSRIIEEGGRMAD